jgi:hypothetical protein
MLLKAALVVPGCSPGSDDEETRTDSPPAPADTAADKAAVTAAVVAFYSGVNEGDGTKACDQLTPAAQRRELEIAKQSDPVANEFLTCAEYFEQVTAVLPENNRSAEGTEDRLRSTVRDVQIEGDTASGTIKVDRRVRFEAEREGDRWRLSSTPGPG